MTPEFEPSVEVLWSEPRGSAPCLGGKSAFGELSN